MANDDKKLTRKSSRSEVDAFLRQVSRTPVTKPGDRRGRLIFAMDATASREPTWDQACRIQGGMFEETAVLGGLDIQICYYRGFGEFEASPWVSNPRDLLRRMTAVGCLGGTTQIGKILRHALRETRRNKVDALVFVGDCMEEDLDKLAGLAGELGILGVPLFLFHEGVDPVAASALFHEGVDPVAASAFRLFARLSGGACCPFDAASAHQLRELLSAVAVYAAGGHRALEDYGRRKGGEVLRLTHQVKKG
jgi:hypothetical protein